MRSLEYWGGTLSLAGGLVHLAAGPSHFSEWWAYGLFFYGAATAQTGYGIILLSQGIEGWGGWTNVRKKFYGLGILGNLSIITLWLVTRLVAIPFGPEAGQLEPFGWLDGISKVIEVTLILVLARLIYLTPEQSRTSDGNLRATK